MAAACAENPRQALAVPPIRYLAILPPITAIGGAVVLLGLASLVSRPMRARVATLGSVVISGSALGISLWQWSDVTAHGAHTYVKQAVVMDGFSVLINILVATAMLLTALVADGYLRREGAQSAEFHVLAMVSASGAMLMGSANDLIIIFLGLEILSIALYVLTAYNHRRLASGEAALKYFILGGFSSAIFVYGIALTYGATGSTNLTQIADFLSKNLLLSNGLLLAGVTLMLVGFAFKVAAVPFHMWTPDVYQGAPTPVTGFMSAVAKAGAFAALLAGPVLLPRHHQHGLEADHLRTGRPVPGPRIGGGPTPARRQAHAGLLVDQPRRVHPPRGGIGPHQRRQRLAVLPVRLHLHDDRELRRHYGPRPQR